MLASGNAVLHMQVASWKRSFNTAACSVWPAYYPVALALVSGRVRADTSVLVPRDAFKVWTPPFLPSRSKRREMQSFIGVAALDIALDLVVPGSDRGLKRKHVIQSTIAAVQVGASLRSQKVFKASAEAMMKFFYPHDWKARFARLLEQKGTAEMHEYKLRLSRKRFDVACMLARRRRAARNNLLRYAMCDASPQQNQSTGIFVITERITKQSDMQGEAFADVSADCLVPRLMPLAT